jgi:glycosyltransferase involved in cell wall biosynthesis
MEKLRICLIASVGGSSGIETYTKELFSALKMRGHYVKVCATDPGVFGEDNTIKIPPQQWKSRLRIALEYPLIPYTARHRSHMIHNIIKNSREDFDILHFTLPEFAYVFNEDTPIISTAWFYPNDFFKRLRIMLPFTPPNLVYKIVYLIDQIKYYLTDQVAFRKSSYVLAVNKKLQRQLSKQGYKCVHVPPGISINSKIPQKEEDELNLFFAANDLGDKRKGLIYLLKAMELIASKNMLNRPILLRLVGNYNENTLLLIQKFALMEKITLHGFISRDEYLKLLSQSDVFVFPSLYEEWGYVVLEALALGVPVVAFDISTMEEIVTKNVGILVPKKDHKLLAQAIVKLASNDKLRRTVSDNAIRYVQKNYSWEVVINKIENIYNLSMLNVKLS